MTSLPVWLTGPMFLLWEVSLSGVLCPGDGLCPEGLGGHCPGGPPPGQRPLYSDDWAIRILLECFLVYLLSITSLCHSQASSSSVIAMEISFGTETTI